jgi:hypothetical protein
MNWNGTGLLAPFYIYSNNDHHHGRPPSLLLHLPDLALALISHALELLDRNTPLNAEAEWAKAEQGQF